MNLLRTAILAFVPMFAGVASAGQTSVLVPSDVKVAAQIDVDQLKTSALGQQLVESVRVGMADALNSDPDSASATEMIEAIGFDPIAETKRITVLCHDFETAKENTVVIFELGKSSGNFEGLLLALPEYQSQVHRDYLVHSVVLEGDRMFGTVHTSQDGTKRIIGAFTAASVQRVVDHFDGQTGAELSRRLPNSSGSLVEINLFDIPREMAAEPPFSAAAEMIETASVKLTDKNQNLHISLNLISSIEAQSEQLRQMIQGGVAMVNSMAQEGTDPTMTMAAGYLETLSVQREGKQVSISIELPQDMLVEQLSAAMAN